MVITVIGAGAMGSIYGGILSKTNDVTLIDTNKELVSKIKSDGIILEENGNEVLYHPAVATSVDGIGRSDLVILFTKSLYSEAALRSAASIIGKDTYLLSLQNGAGHEELLSRFVDKNHVIIGTTEDNGAVLGLGKVHHGGSGITNVGYPFSGDAAFLDKMRECFDGAGFKLRIWDNINQLVWDKLMVNSSLSTLTAIIGCDMSFIAENSHAFEICSNLLAETVEVAKHMGLTFDYDLVLEKVKKTSLSNKGGYTSIMKDIENGRKTEVETISGAVVSKAKELGIPVPHQAMAVSIIHALECKSK